MRVAWLEKTAAVLVYLQDEGVSADTLEMLVHGDGRGRVAPNVLQKALQHAFANIADTYTPTTDSRGA